MAEYLGGAIALAIAGAALWRSGRKPLSTALWLSSAGVLILLGYLGQPLFEFRGAAQRLAETAGRTRPARRPQRLLNEAMRRDAAQRQAFIRYFSAKQ